MNLPSTAASAPMPGNSVTALATTAPPTRVDSSGFQPFGEDGLTFFDVLDAINPLQHLPIVSTIYRALTGDTIAPIPRIAGGSLFGGLIGAVASAVNVLVEEISGSDIGEHALAFLGDVTGFEIDDDPEPAATAADEDIVPMEGFEPPPWAGTPVPLSTLSAVNRYARTEFAAAPARSAHLDVLG